MAANEREGSEFLSIAEVAKLRVDYINSDFNEGDLPVKEPLKLFDLWFKDAMAREDIPEANVMTLSTCGKDWKPISRVVLLKGYDERGFRFFSNYHSRKGKAIEENPNVSLSFFWEPLHRQVIVQGAAERLPLKESTEYFHSRPRGSQIGALVSKQSTVIEGRHVLIEREKELIQIHGNEDVLIPKPEHWGGYIVKPELVEFWSGRQSRLHDRIVFRRLQDGEDVGSSTHMGANGWVYERLSP